MLNDPAAKDMPSTNQLQTARQQEAWSKKEKWVVEGFIPHKQARAYSKNIVFSCPKTAPLKEWAVINLHMYSRSCNQKNDILGKK